MITVTTPMDPERALWVDTGIPPRARSLTLDSLGRNGRNLPQLATATTWVAELPARQRVSAAGAAENPGHGLGLLLFGGPGTGKSTVALALACDARRQGWGVRYTSWPRYVEQEKLLFQPADDEAHIAAYKAVSLLDTTAIAVVDQVGDEHQGGSGYAGKLLSQVLRWRFEKGLPTILTTSFTDEQWADRYGAGLASFAREACRPVSFLGPDLRGAG